MGIVTLSVTATFAILLIASPETVGRSWIFGLLIAVGTTGVIASAIAWTGRRSRAVILALVIHTALAAAWLGALIFSPMSYAFPLLAGILWAVYGRRSQDS